MPRAFASGAEPAPMEPAAISIEIAFQDSAIALRQSPPRVHAPAMQVVALRHLTATPTPNNAPNASPTLTAKQANVPTALALRGATVPIPANQRAQVATTAWPVNLSSTNKTNPWVLIAFLNAVPTSNVSGGLVANKKPRLPKFVWSLNSSSA